MRIYLLLGHPDRDSFNGAIADRYEAAARLVGHEVRRHNLGEMQFDPILWHGYRREQKLEPDLRAAQDNIRWAEHWVIVYPVWWGAAPALLKGFIDRTLTAEFAYRHHARDPLSDGLLAGRSARLIATADAPSLWLWVMYRNSDVSALKQATLRFCGLKPVRVTRIGHVRYLDGPARETELRRVAAIAAQENPAA